MIELAFLPCPHDLLGRHLLERLDGDGTRLVVRERLWVEPPRRTEPASALLSDAVDRLPLSGRGRIRVARVSRAIAALAGSSRVEVSHVAEALRYLFQPIPVR